MRYLYTGPVSALSLAKERTLTLVPGQTYELPDSDRVRRLVARGHLVTEAAQVPVAVAPQAPAAPSVPAPREPSPPAADKKPKKDTQVS
jgi:hypothetical protein